MSASAGILLSASSLSEVAQFLRVSTNRLDVDYGLHNGGSRVVCMGDWHVGYSVKDEFIRIMPELKESGLTDAATEGGVSDQTFAFALQEGESRESDWVVHLARKPEL